jgi:SAM-dependent methyltransferase
VSPGGAVNNGTSLDFTGERFLPAETGPIRYEHLHRYAVAREFVDGKTVLDIACGEGYGSILLAGRALHVVGVDIDSMTVDHAARTYANDTRVRFLGGRCDAIPLADASVEVVVSFETIEHHDRHEEMMKEIKRVLRPGGLLILSSPNRRVYSDEPCYQNPFHVKELYRDELLALLKRHFAAVRLYGQTTAIGSFLYPVDREGATAMDPPPWGLLIEGVDGAITSVADDQAALYYLTLCSDDPGAVASSIRSAYFSPYDDTLKRRESGHRQALSDLEVQNGYLTDLQTYLVDREQNLLEAHRSLGESHERLVAAEAEKKALADRIAEIEQTRWWRFGLRLKRLIGRGGV